MYETCADGAKAACKGGLYMVQACLCPESQNEVNSRWLFYFCDR